MVWELFPWLNFPTYQGRAWKFIVTVWGGETVSSQPRFKKGWLGMEGSWMMTPKSIMHKNSVAPFRFLAILRLEKPQKQILDLQ